MRPTLSPALLALTLVGGVLASASGGTAHAAQDDPAATLTHLAVHRGQLIATVEAAPVDPTPTGRVVFTVDGRRIGAAPLVADAEPGVAHATLPRGVRSTGEPQLIDAAYAGDGTLDGSHETYRRVDPVVVATVTSASPALHGWHHTPTEVAFACTDGSAHADCPAAVSKRATVATSVVRRRILADDGGTARVEVVDHRTDPWAPRLDVHRRGEAPYGRTARPVRCAATDTRSGVAGPCRVTYERVVRMPGGRLTRRYAVRATDVAGNERVRRGAFTVRR